MYLFTCYLWVLLPLEAGGRGVTHHMTCKIFFFTWLPFPHHSLPLLISVFFLANNQVKASQGLSELSVYHCFSGTSVSHAASSTHPIYCVLYIPKAVLKIAWCFGHYAFQGPLTTWVSLGKSGTNSSASILLARESGGTQAILGNSAHPLPGSFSVPRSSPAVELVP
jgi:hypothetical protein